MIATSAQFTRHHVEQRDKGVCADCGTDTTKTLVVLKLKEYADKSWGWGGATNGFGSKVAGPFTYIFIGPMPWDADHVVPLWAVNRDEPDAFKYWTLDNLQTLCDPCHKKKTKKEAADRAKMKRLVSGGRRGAKAKRDKQLEMWREMP